MTKKDMDDARYLASVAVRRVYDVLYDAFDIGNTYRVGRHHTVSSNTARAVAKDSFNRANLAVALYAAIDKAVDNVIDSVNAICDTSFNPDSAAFKGAISANRTADFQLRVATFNAALEYNKALKLAKTISN